MKRTEAAYKVGFNTGWKLASEQAAITVVNGRVTTKLISGLQHQDGSQIRERKIVGFFDFINRETDRQDLILYAEFFEKLAKRCRRLAKNSLEND
jgi:hypothetical protein